jgi:uncharacterized protein YkwD
MKHMSLLVVLACAVTVLAHEDKDKSTELTKAEQTILDLTNKERATEKLDPFVINPVLTRVARAHSANMARKGEMQHDLDGKTPAQRIEEAGYDYKRVGENIAWTDGDTLENVMKGLMNSRGHRENILNPGYTEIGIGIARNEKGVTYFTQDFGKPRK